MGLLWWKGMYSSEGRSSVTLVNYSPLHKSTSFFFFFFWLHVWYIEVPRLGIEPTLLLRQCQILNLLHYSGNSTEYCVINLCLKTRNNIFYRGYFFFNSVHQFSMQPLRYIAEGQWVTQRMFRIILWNEKTMSTVQWH